MKNDNKKSIDTTVEKKNVQAEVASATTTANGETDPTPVVKPTPTRGARSTLRSIVRTTKAVLTLLLLLAFAYGAIWSYAKAYPWLETHKLNFVHLENPRVKRTGPVKEEKGEKQHKPDVSKLPEATPDRVPAIVQQSLDGVVTIAVDRSSYQPGVGLVEGDFNIGTGFIVDPGGIIVTNQHVVRTRDTEYKVILNDGTEYQVKDIARDDVNDIAIVKIDAKDLHALKLGDSDALLPGQGVIAMGNPLGQFAGSVTTGVISGLKRSVSTGSSFGMFGGGTLTYDGVIQTDAAINPGNSGGPLLNYDGEVIGINFATTAGADNISFALPINRVKKRIKEYRTLGRFTKPMLGVQVHMITAGEAKVYDNVIEGAYILKVLDQSPAQEAGLKPKDIIHKVDGEIVDRSLVSIIQSHEVGDTVELEVWRFDENDEGQVEQTKRTVSVTLSDGSTQL